MRKSRIIPSSVEHNRLTREDIILGNASLHCKMVYSANNRYQNIRKEDCYLKRMIIMDSPLR